SGRSIDAQAAHVRQGRSAFIARICRLGCRLAAGIPGHDDGETIVCSSHKIAGPQTNDVIFQLRKKKIDKVILAGMAANFCVESHLRDFVEHGFEVAVVRDATAGSKLPEGDAYRAALVNFRWFANAVWTTATTVEKLNSARDR
ncbi:isochorismatase family protein, partial [Candidatus Phyllobacterium onerii]|uniref:isochorismatase family protein n=1 Tax=Candidatus Phyllobacterium onerii TaxID=3020828 RepID=UPI00232F9765